METPQRIKEAAQKYQQRRAAIKERVHTIAKEVQQTRQDQKAKLARQY